MFCDDTDRGPDPGEQVIVDMSPSLWERSPAGSARGAGTVPGGDISHYHADVERAEFDIGVVVPEWEIDPHLA